MNKIPILLLIPLFVGCATQVEQPIRPAPSYSAHIEAIEATDEQLEKAKQAVLKELKDPYSAVFENIYAVRIDKKEGSVSYCGTVNAKNSYGGYIGAKPFRVSDFGRVYLWDERGPAFNKGITPYCLPF